MIRDTLRRAARSAVLLAPLVSHADPLHPLPGDSYWHHESNFIFPATLAGFSRAGAPQELDGSTIVTAYYARGDGAARLVVIIEVMPDADASPETAQPGANRFLRVIDHAGWRVIVRASLPDDAASAHIEALVGALPVDRLGAIDARCPNPGCGS